MPAEPAPGGPAEPHALGPDVRAAVAARLGANLAGALSQQHLNAAAAGLALARGGVLSWPAAEADASPQAPDWDLLDAAGLRTLLKASPVVLVGRNVGRVRARGRTVVRFAEGALRGPGAVHVTRADSPVGWDARVQVRIVFGESGRAVADALTERLVPGAQDLVGDGSLVRAEQRLQRSAAPNGAAGWSAEAGMLALVLELSRSVDVTLIGASWGELVSRPPWARPDLRWRRRRTPGTPVYRARVESVR